MWGLLRNLSIPLSLAQVFLWFLPQQFLFLSIFSHMLHAIPFSLYRILALRQQSFKNKHPWNSENIWYKLLWKSLDWRFKILLYLCRSIDNIIYLLISCCVYIKLESIEFVLELLETIFKLITRIHIFYKILFQLF